MSQTHPKISRSISIYLLAALVGMVAAWFLKPPTSDRGPRASKAPKLLRSTETSLEEVALVDAFISSVGVGSDQKQADPHADFRKLLTEIEPTSDPEGTFRALLADWERMAPLDQFAPLSPEQLEALSLLSARFSQWLEVNPHEAIAAVKQLDTRVSNKLTYFIIPILGHLFEKQGIQSGMKWLPEIEPSHIAVMHLGTYFGKSADVEDLRWFLSEHSEFPTKAYAEGLQESIGDNWPIDRRDELIGELSGDGKLRAMIALARRMEGSEGIEWFELKLDLDEITPEELNSGPVAMELKSFLSRMDAPLEDRVSLMQRFGVAPAEITHAYKAQQLVHRDITNYLVSWDAEQDWLYWFQSGEVSAKEVYDAVLENVPDPGSEINEFKSQMFRHLAEEDPSRAMELLDDMSQSEQDWQKAYAARWWFTGVDPNHFHQLTSSISYANDPDMQQFIRESWNEKSRSNLERYGEGYVEWVNRLPEGQDRQWALEGLEQASRNIHPGIHRDVSELLGNSK